MQNVMMLWMTTPIERNLRLLRSATKISDDASIFVMIEIAYTRPFNNILTIKYLYE